MDILGKRKWLNLNECAKYLRKTLNDDIGVSDVARLIADGELKPSIFFHSCCFIREVQITSKTLSHVLSEPETAITSNIHLLSQEALLTDTPIIHATPIGEKIIFTEGIWSALHIGIIKYEAEKKYSEEQGLPKPKRSLYETKGIILADGEKKFQVVQKIDFEREMIELVKLSQSQSEEENGFFKAHIERFEQIRNVEIKGNLYDSFVPCIGLPENAYFAIKKEDIDEFVSICMPASKKASSKTTNKQAEFIYALIAAHYGEDIANNPRSHIDNGEIKLDLESKGFTVPSGNTVSGWLKNIVL
ncbi:MULTISPECIES: hypothetical protein [Xenorhabdus]|uniref:hypothetical protein n=1 Tax=Xenorhabdus TaxID=626 RepID=UPI00064A2B55|nr:MULTISPECIES: hypothetical protein [Xenorhabdus]KLU16725.1 hypothetical protein AAY47_03745 [Xenorhabdus griffiniae]KOP34293.1 hypothetical protein AFK69_05495 [Xenorhabdus sp. GDc328]